MKDVPLKSIAKENEWDAHWTSLDAKRSVFSLLSVATRRLIFQPAVAHYAKQFFPENWHFC